MYNLELELAKIVSSSKNNDKIGSFKGEITWGCCGLIMYILNNFSDNVLLHMGNNLICESHT